MVTGGAGRGRTGAKTLTLFALLVLLALPSSAGATLDEADGLVYMPYGLIHSPHSAEFVDEALAEADSFGLGQLVFATPKVSAKTGAVKIPKRNRAMLALWSSRASAYDAEHGAALSVTLVVPAKVKGVKGGGTDLESASIRGQIVAGIEAAFGLRLGLAGVQLDFEPYPTNPGYLALLEELDAMFARVGFHGRFSVAAPASVARWSPSYLKAVSALVTQLDPLYYDSEIGTIPEYEAWMRESLAYYSANAVSGARIVPILPAYSANRWHDPSVEKISTATNALSAALGAGARVNGAGIWWGYGFFYDEEGAYDPSADRAAWQSSTRPLPFSP
ncbi:MAG TPA: hypothetical protein VMB05_16880 [Solirubrobacteraceae bacterium]|nr:hypothetical protein [Solirubrobacteraceae bacterium]